jgi:hypothetical protein
LYEQGEYPKSRIPPAAGQKPMNRESRKCQNCRNDFVIEPEDFNFYERIKVPPPTWCPECRMLRRFLFRNEKNLYKRKCDATGKEIFSMFHDKSPVRVYDRDYWWSDKWDAGEYAREYDFNQPFFEQFARLLSQVPLYSRSVNDMVNSDYCMNCGEMKNCYLVFNSSHDESCMYGTVLEQSKECLDSNYLTSCELCYGCFMCYKCYRALFSVDCENSNNIYFCKDLMGCSDCFGCVGLRNKKYHIFNQPYSKEDYLMELQKFNLGSQKSVAELQDRFRDLILKYPVKYAHVRHNTSVSGDYIRNSKNALWCYHADRIEDCKYCQFLMTPTSKDCYDYSIWGWNSELIYECCQIGVEAHGLKFCLFAYPACQNLTYCVACASSSNLFACVGLRNKQYCILNKQYTKEEYEALVPKIIEHMNSMPYVDKQGRVYKYGEFFPPELSPFAYNETIAQEYFPLTKEEALAQGYRWKEREERNLKPDLYTPDLPDHIKDVDDSILGKVIQCAHAQREEDDTLTEGCNQMCTTAFKIIPQELEFYKRMNLPLPRLCPNCRHFERLKQRNPLKLWHRKCTCAGEQSKNGLYRNTAQHFHGQDPCPNEFETSYAPDRPEIVYCEACYNSEVV